MAVRSIKSVDTINMLVVLIVLFQSALNHAFPLHNSSVSGPAIQRMPNPKMKFGRDYHGCGHDRELIEDTLTDIEVMVSIVISHNMTRYLNMRSSFRRRGIV